MDWKEDRKYVLEALKDQKNAHREINESIKGLSNRVIGTVHGLDKRTVTLESRVKLIGAGLVLAIGAVIKKYIG